MSVIVNHLMLKIIHYLDCQDLNWTNNKFLASYIRCVSVAQLNCLPCLLRRPFLWTGY